jgi:uncharacterized protein YndB with AHSA1/START domain
MCNRTFPENPGRKSRERVISVSADILADRRQLLYALTLPEYLEAWITPADGDADAGERVAMRCGTAYAIEYVDLSGKTITIEGVFRASSRDKVVLTWRRGSFHSTRQSVVAIKLNGNFAFTTLILTHTGVMTDPEYCWLRDLWDLSIMRLKSLVEGCRVKNCGASPARCSPSA